LPFKKQEEEKGEEEELEEEECVLSLKVITLLLT